MKKMGCLMIWMLVIGFGCTPGDVKPITDSDLSDLVGKWKGTMSVPFYGEKYQTAPVRPTAELTIFNSNLRGRLTKYFTNVQTRSIAFFGKIEGGKLVSYWKDGSWVKLTLSKADGRLKLVGDYDFGKTAGTMSLEKVR